MNMYALSIALVWCVVQVSIVTIVAAALMWLARRRPGGSSATFPAAALAVVLIVTACAFVPWPEAWRYGPNLANNANWLPSRPSSLAPKAQEIQPRSDALNEPILILPNNILPEGPRGDPAEDFTGNQEALADTTFPVEPAEVANALSDTSVEDPPAASGATETTREPEQATLTQPDSQGPSVGASLGLALTGIFLLGAGLGLGRLLFGLVSISGYRHASRPIENRALKALAQMLQAELGCRQVVELRKTATLASAATIGFWKPIILLPLEWQVWSEPQRRAILAHELAHVTRYDYLTNILAQFSLALHFYHPLVHWLANQFRLEQEISADQLAASVAGGNDSYLRILAALALEKTNRPVGWPARNFLPTQGTLLRRIEMLRVKDRPKTGWMHGASWPRLLLIAGCFAAALLLAGLRGPGERGQLTAQADEPNNSVLSPPVVPINPNALAPPYLPPSVGKIPANAPGTAPLYTPGASAGGNPGGDPAAKNSLSVLHIPNHAIGFLGIRLAELCTDPEVAALLEKLDPRSPEAKNAVPLGSIKQITFVVVASPTVPRPLELVLLETLQPVDFSRASLFQDHTGKPCPAFNPKEAAEEAGPQPAENQNAYFPLSQTAFVFGTKSNLREYLTLPRGNPLLAEAKGWNQLGNTAITAAIDMVAARQLGESHLTVAPLELEPFTSETETIFVGIETTPKVTVRAIAECLGSRGADRVEKSANNLGIFLRAGLQSILTNRSQNAGAPSAMFLSPAAQKMAAVLDKLAANMEASRYTNESVLATASVSRNYRGESVVATLIDFVQQESKQVPHQISQNNLTRLILAMHMYHDTYQHFPPAMLYGKDGKGKVPHSWRVALLPFLEQEKLYNEYQFDEPWDSPANKKVLEKMPSVFRHPSDQDNSTHSAYFGLIGNADEKLPGSSRLPTLFSSKLGARMADITDGLSNTIALVEAKRDIPWTKPEDIAYVEGELPKLGGYSGNGFNYARCDGTVGLFPKDFPQPAIALRILISPQGGETLPPEMEAIIVQPIPPHPYGPPARKQPGTAPKVPDPRD